MSNPNNGSAPQGRPNIDLYTRNGFAGPAATIIRSQYTPPYTRVRGDYAPYRFDVSELQSGAQSASGVLPVPLLVGEGVSVEVSFKTEASPVAIRNVLADEMHYVLEGRARLETDFGVLELTAGDFVLLPRAVTYRYAEVSQALREIIVVTDSELSVDPEYSPGVLNVDLHVDAPVHDPMNTRDDKEFEVVIRHGRDTTSYFYDCDPLAGLATGGAPIVRRFNFQNVGTVGATHGGIAPPRLFNDPTTRVLIFNLSNRASERPPVHHNADYDEVIFYVAGPAKWGSIGNAGTVTWTPKGLIHQGPDEDVPEGYNAWLLETRAALTMTPEARTVASLMETAAFDIHPSAANREIEV